MLDTASPVKKTGCLFFVATFVFGPGLMSCTTCLDMLVLLLLVSLPPTRGQTREDEDRFDTESVQGPQVSFDSGGEGEGRAACRGEQGLSRCWIFEQLCDIMGSIDTETGVGEGGKRDECKRCARVTAHSPIALLALLRLMAGQTRFRLVAVHCSLPTL